MFNSVEDGYIPICIIAVMASWFVSGVRDTSLRVMLSIVAPVAISASWAFLPRLPDLFRPLPPGKEPWVHWLIMAVMVWSVVAVPIGVVSVLVFNKIRKRKQPLKGSVS